MGKGDKKSKHGKIIMGSYGVRRPRRKNTEKVLPVAADVKPEKTATKPTAKPVEAKVTEPKPKAVKKPKAEVKPELPETEEQV